jgi:catechol 2,3-dioxygenase-like lactoylglutathione lyase family enzyme
MIQHVTREIPASVLDACVHFYMILGFEPVQAPPGVEGRAVWMAQVGDPDGVHLHLMLNDESSPAPGHVAFVVERYDEVVAALSDRGFALDPRREHWGSPRSYVRDPASNLVELMARAPAVTRPTPDGPRE